MTKPLFICTKESLCDYSIRNTVKNGRVLVWISKSRVNNVPAWIVHYPDQPENQGTPFLLFREAKSCAMEWAAAAMQESKTDLFPPIGIRF
jgi:hypothetical protein